VRVLKLYPSDHPGDLEQTPKACWPIGDGQSGVVAGDQPAGNNQQKGQSGNKYGKAMMSGVIRGRGQNCSLRVLNILASGIDPLDKYKTFATRRNGVSGEFFKLSKSPELPKLPGLKTAPQTAESHY
jgi:hypothetical protein